MESDNQANITASISATVYTNIPEAIEEHMSNTTNPHAVTKEIIGLGNVDNTPDIDKPISTAQQEVFDSINSNINSLSETIDEINSTYVKDSTYPTTSSSGVVKVDTAGKHGLTTSEDGLLSISSAQETDIINRISNYKPITPSTLDYAIKDGIVNNSIELSDEEQTSVRGKINAIGVNDYATADKMGLMRTESDSGLFLTNGILYTQKATEEDINEKTSKFKPIVPETLDYAVKTSLTTSNEWTEEEQDKARNLIKSEKLHPNKNLIHNSEFLVNLRGKTIYDIESVEKTTVDRWKKAPKAIVEVLKNVGVSVTNTDTTKAYGIRQYLFDTDLILGNQLTITIQTPDNKYVYTTDAFPTSMNKTFATIQQISTEFGSINIYWGNEHFRLEIAINPVAEGETPVPFIINWVKAEVGTESTPFEPMPYKDLIMLCRYFYAPALNDILTVGYARITSTKTECFFPCPIVHEFFLQPQIYADSLEGKISLGGETPRDVTFSQIMASARNKDYSYQVVKCTIKEDNTEKLNGATELYEICIGKYNGVWFDGELAR